MDETSKGYMIVDDMPIPELSARRQYPFNDLEVGQCALIDPEDKDHEAAIRVAASARNRRSNKRFIVRRIPGTDFRVGIWRTE